MEKKEYQAPEMEIISFTTEDVITSSGGPGGKEQGGDVDDD